MSGIITYIPQQFLEDALHALLNALPLTRKALIQNTFIRMDTPHEETANNALFPYKKVEYPSSRLLFAKCITKTENRTFHQKKAECPHRKLRQTLQNLYVLIKKAHEIDHGGETIRGQNINDGCPPPVSLHPREMA